MIEIVVNVLIIQQTTELRTLADSLSQYACYLWRPFVVSICGSQRIQSNPSQRLTLHIWRHL